MREGRYPEHANVWEASHHILKHGCHHENEIVQVLTVLTGSDLGEGKWEEGP